MKDEPDWKISKDLEKKEFHKNMTNNNLLMNAALMSMYNGALVKNTQQNTIAESNQFIALKKLRQFKEAKRKRKTIHS